MESYKQHHFITQDEIEKLINIRLSDIRRFLKIFVKFEGLVSSNKPIKYVEGFFEIGDSELCDPQLSPDKIESGYNVSESNIPRAQVVKSIFERTPFSFKQCSVEELQLINPIKINETFYSYDQLIHIMKRFKCPPPKNISELSGTELIPLKKVDYPPELQLAIDAFEQLCFSKVKQPANNKIKEWLQQESKKRGITHKDGVNELKGLSEVKLKVIPSLIKS